MGWELELFDVLDDLEQRAAGVFSDNREWELADVGRADYAEVDAAGRLAASLGSVLTCSVVGVGRVTGTLERIGSGWVLLRAGTMDWLLPESGLISVEGLSPRARPEVARAGWERLSLRSALLLLGEAGETCLLHTIDGGAVPLRPLRVGADFLEGMTGHGRPVVVRLSVVTAIRSDPPLQS
ncbi:MAG: hypothetical protein WAW88_10175 [Nocardioides sp.]